MKSLVLVLSLINLIAFAEHKSLNCSKADERRVDVVFSKLFTVGDASRKFPTNEAETKQYCNETKELLKEAENYSKKCLIEAPKQLTSVLIYTIKNMVNQVCKTGSKRLPKLLAAAPCINNADKELNKCVVKSIDVYLGIQNADHKMKVPYVCCQTYALEECIIDGLKKSECNESHADITRQFINTIIGNIMDLLCTEYNNSDKCEKLSEPPNKTKQQRRTKSLILPMIDVFDSFPLI